MEDLKTIELIIDENNEKYEVDAISLVENPAIEEDFIALSKEEVKFKAIDEDKRILVGLALVPDKKILRSNEQGLYNIIMSKETVKKAAHLYLKRLKLNNATLEHESSVGGVSVVESWMVEDIAMDKLNLYGVKPIEGAWAVIMKVDNDEVWNDVKLGKYLGFSIEGIFKPVEMQENFSADKDISDEELFSQMVDYLKNKDE